MTKHLLYTSPLLFTSMAAFCVNHSFYCTNSSVHELRIRSRNCPKILVVFSCQNNESIEKSTSTAKKEQTENKQLFSQVFAGVHKFGGGLKENMSPQQKGDWKDLMLMTLSFAVYVYMSQKIVCAYFAWTYMPSWQTLSAFCVSNYYYFLGWAGDLASSCTSNEWGYC